MQDVGELAHQTALRWDGGSAVLWIGRLFSDEQQLDDIEQTVCGEMEHGSKHDARSVRVEGVGLVSTRKTP
jgi:hypothetical protein